MKDIVHLKSSQPKAELGPSPPQGFALVTMVVNNCALGLG